MLLQVYTCQNATFWKSRALAHIYFNYFRITGLYPDAERFGLYTAEVFILHYWGEIVCVACMGLFMNPSQANSVAALIQAASVLISSGLLK